jgi:copper resistance protein B
MIAAVSALLSARGALAQDPPQASPASPPAATAASEGSSATETPASTRSQSDHVPPEPPTTEIHPMSSREMTQMMGMNDAAALGMLLVDQLEWREGDGLNGPAWNAQGWYGTDYNKLWFKIEGERFGSVTQDGRVELLWDRIFSRWWSWQAGVRHDFGNGPSRNWLALGVQGLAPYWFNIEATAYVGDAGRTAARLEAEYELLFTQRLILQPEFEVNAYGKDDPERQIGAGFSNFQLGLRLRYEFRREFAPYIGVVWERSLGKTEDMVRAAGEDPSVFQVLAGIRFWF